jgi:hypothetical protein
MSTVRDAIELVFGSDDGGFGARWRLWSARRAKASSASDALAIGQRSKIVGVARALEATLTAPFTQRAALVQRHSMLEKRLAYNPQGREIVTWKVEIRDAGAVPFLLEGDGGRSVVVDPRGAVLGFADEEVKEHPHVNDDNPAFRAYLRRNGILSTMFMGIAGDHRFFEAVIAPGDRVAVWGVVGEATNVVASGYRDAAARTMTITGTPQDPCVLLRA